MPSNYTRFTSPSENLVMSGKTKPSTHRHSVRRRSWSRCGAWSTARWRCTHSADSNQLYTRHPPPCSPHPRCTPPLQTNIRWWKFHQVARMGARDRESVPAPTGWESEKFNFFYQLVGFECPTSYDCPHRSSCIHIQAKWWFIGHLQPLKIVQQKAKSNH